jgi:anti-sigma B factor antagonist
VEISTRKEGGIVIADLVGSLDTQTSGPASEEMSHIIGEASGKLLVNMEKLEFLSSAGLRVLLRAAKEIQASGGMMKMCQPSGVVKEVLDISGFASFLDIHDSESEALATFSA